MIVLKQADSVYNFAQKNEITLEYIYHILFIFLGFISSKGSIVGEFSPFGTSLIAGVTKKYILSTAIGSIIGYLFPVGSLSGFKYIAAVFAVGLIRFCLSSFTKLEKSAIFSAIIAFCSVIFTGVAVIAENPDYTFKIIAEAFLSSAGGFFINHALRIKPYKKPGLYTEELVAVCFFLSIIVLGLTNIQIDKISFGKILAVVFILTAAKFGGASVGALTGVLFGFVISIGLSLNTQSYFYMASGGLFAGFFRAAGKLSTALSFTAVAFITAVFSGDMQLAIVVVIESLIASGIFMFIPKNFLSYLSGIFMSKPEVEDFSGIKGALVMRLNFASNALKDVSSTVKDVSNELSKINTPDYETVLKNVEEQACKGCSLCVHCWENNKSETVEAVLGLSKIIKQPDVDAKTVVPHNFLGRCLRFSLFQKSVSIHYSDYLSKINANNRIEEIRGVVEDHFNGISSMLNDLSYEFKYAQTLDENATSTIITTLRNMNINVSQCSAVTDKFGRLSADIKVKLDNDTILNKRDILKKLSIACDKDFDVPSITKVEKEAFISITEKPIYYVEMGVAQYAAGNNSMCGDTCEYFSDGKGRLCMLLSDGMGVGGRAAVDSHMVTGLFSRLIKSGFGYDCALKITNSSMLFKSTDESLATVDISVIDLFSGKTELLKAGAAPTIVRRKGRTAKAASTSLPAGILREVGFDKADVTLRQNDIILMMSDGVINDGTDWICAYLEEFEGSAQFLAETIAQKAKRRNNLNKEDDITVMVGIVKKN